MNQVTFSGEQVAHKDIGKSVDSEVSGDLKRGYLCIGNPKAAVCGVCISAMSSLVFSSVCPQSC